MANRKLANEKLPFERMGIPDFPARSLDLNEKLFENAAAEIPNHEQPIIPAWSMWEKLCRLAQWNYLLGDWEACKDWSGKAAA